MRGSGMAYSAGSASIYGGGASTRALAGPSASYVAGGMPYEGDSRVCSGTTKHGLPCTAPCTSDTDFCVGHNKQIRKQQQQSEEA